MAQEATAVFDYGVAGGPFQPTPGGGGTRVYYLVHYRDTVSGARQTQNGVFVDILDANTTQQNGTAITNAISAGGAALTPAFTTITKMNIPAQTTINL